MTSLVDRTATQLLADLAAGDTTSVALTEACLEQIKRHDPQVQAFLRVDGSQRSSARPRSMPAARPANRWAAWPGLPVAIKDLLCTQGETTTCASRMLENFVPPYDATVVAGCGRPTPC